MDLFENKFDQTIIDPTKDYYPELVGEDKKYKTNQDLARAAVEKDSFIERLKRENADVRNILAEMNQDLSARKRLEDLVDQLASGQTKTPSNTNNQNVEQTQNSVASPEEIAKLVKNSLMEDAAKQRQNENLEKVASKLQEHWGDSYSQKLTEHMNTLGMDKVSFSNVAKTSPEAFLRMVGIQEKREERTLFTPPSTQVNTTAMGPARTNKNWAYYQEMRRKDPVKYSSIEVQNELYATALAYAEKGLDFTQS